MVNEKTRTTGRTATGILLLVLTFAVLPFAVIAPNIGLRILAIVVFIALIAVGTRLLRRN
jgi:hypothetical protein